MPKHRSISTSAAISGLGLLILLSTGVGTMALAVPPPPKAAEETAPESFWIGVRVQHPLPDAVRAQLSIPKDEGLLVEEVVPSTPAEGKLKVFDVIVKAGDKSLKSSADLVAAVDAAKGGKLPLEVLREGKAMRLEVTPVQRPLRGEGDLASEILRVNPNLDNRALAQALKFLDQEGQPLRFYAMRPGWVLRPGTPLEAPLPANVTITVTKQGEQPAKIVVKRDDKTWEVTEKELDKLPNDLRPHVEMMLGRGAGRLTLEPMGRPQRPEVLPPVGPKAPNPDNPDPGVSAPPKVGSRPRLENQLDDIRQQIDQLRKTLDELRAQQAAPKAEKK